MPSTKTIKQRIRSIKNTSQITKAMEVVSATKMRKSQEFALRARPYAAASLEMMHNLLGRIPRLPPLLQRRAMKKAALLVVTSDKGLAGAFNANVIKKAEQWIEEKKRTKTDFALVTVGKKAKEHFERRKFFIQKSFLGFGDYSSLEETLPVAVALIDEFLAHEYDAADAVYTHFRTTLAQETVLRKILPATESGIEEIVRGILPEHGRFSELPTTYNLQATSYQYEYIFEPRPLEILDALIPQIIRMHIHHIILESNASEHSARMVAMKNASDNAKELITDLTLAYNKARQAGITREIVEITAGKEALEQ